VIASSQSTIGVPMLVGEQELLRHLAAEARRHYKLAREAEQELARCSKGHTPTEGMGAVVGVTTAAVLTSCLGDPRDYPAAAAYVKAAGLNLKEQSSGKHLGQIKITKRGPSEARRLLYLATLRLIQEHGDPILREWYERKVRREGGKRKKKAVVALMRKLLGALWHVAAGERFDSQRLFDTRSLLVSRVLRS
jgi:transposase